jgi:hypothetical protein
MIQSVFDFAKNPVFDQLELFPKEIYDNRIQRLSYALRISYRIDGWSPYKLDNLKECVKLFRVMYKDVINEYTKLLGNEMVRFE